MTEPLPKIFKMRWGDLYPAYVAKVQRKGRTQDDVDRIIGWLTGYSPAELAAHVAGSVTVATFFRDAPAPHNNRRFITGVVCGVRVETVSDPVMREIRYLDKLVDELARGKPLTTILRTGGPPDRLPPDTDAPGT